MERFNLQNQDYEFEVKLSNGTNEMILGTEAIISLDIKENLFQWFTEGSITIDNLYLNFYRHPPKSSEGSATSISYTDEQIKKLFYKFRNDGRDTIKITIKPYIDPSLSTMKNMIEEKNWILEMEGVIYDVEESNITHNEKRYITLFFWDKTYQLMREKNAEFSTATKALEKNNKTIYNATNQDRSLRTGEAIKQLLKENGFEKHCKLITDNTNDKWTMGDDKNTVMYTSPSNYRMIQDLQYLLDIHCGDESTGYDPCIFKLERPEEVGKVRQFTLIPISEYFKKAGKDNPSDYQIELFKIASSVSENNINSDSIPMIKKAPTTINEELKQNFFMMDYSVINGYKFVEMNPLDATSELTNYFLVNYNIKNKQFNIQMDKIEDAETHIKENYIRDNVVYKTTPEIVFPKNNYATLGHNTTVRYTLNFTESSRKSEGRNKAILSSLFKNMAISFNARGATIRQPGRFIGILMGRYENEQDFDNRLEGQYLITEVNHSFQPKNKQYHNNIIAVKCHLYDKDKYALDYTDDVELIKES